MMYVVENFNNWSRSSASHLLHFGLAPGPLTSTVIFSGNSPGLNKVFFFFFSFWFVFFFSLVMAYKCSCAGWLCHGRKKKKIIHLVNVNSLCKLQIMHPRARLVYASRGSMRHSPWCWGRTHSLQSMSITLHCCIGARLECACSIHCTKRKFPCGTCVLHVNNEFLSQAVSSAIAHFDPFFWIGEGWPWRGKIGRAYFL